MLQAWRMRAPDRARYATLLGLAVASIACSGGSPAAPAASAVPEVIPAELGTPDLRLLVITDLRGALQPCGCTSRPLGGIDRLAAALAAARADHPDALFLAAGELFAGATEPSELPGAETQDQWRTELLADLLSDFDLAAGVPGPRDVERGPARLLALRERARFPMLGAGVTFDATDAAASAAAGATAPDAAPPAPPAPPAPLAGHRVASAGARRIGLVGVTAMSGPAVHGPADLVAAADAEARAARAEGASFVVVLTSADRRTAHRIAASDQVDLVIEGGRDEADVRPPGESEGAPVLSVGRHGQGLLIVDLFDLPAPDAPRARPRDVSSWTRTADRDRLLRQAADLRARLDAEGEAAGADHADARARLEELDREIARVVAAPDVSGPHLSLTYVELPEDAARDAAVRARLDDFARRVNLHNREAFESHFAEPAAPGQPGYEGTTLCGVCHTEEALWWNGTAHGHAYRTLRERHSEYNLDCVGCHVTGYEEPGGSTVAHVEALQSVGCESCHGPGSIHLRDQHAPVGNVHRQVTEATCTRCHTPEHSDLFDFEEYRRQMITPVHGGTP